MSARTRTHARSDPRSRARVRRIVGLVAAVALAAGWLAVAPARGEGTAEEARAALEKAIAEGKKLYTQSWGEGSKACAECHGPGPNKLRGARLKTYPKWDKTAGKVISGQQKLNQMIEQMAKGQPFGLGSDELNALEAYVSTLR